MPTSSTTPPAAPTVSGLSPTSGSTGGGTSVTISGTNFTGATSVTFGGTSVAFTVTSGTRITASSPAHPAGVVDVRVTTGGGQSAVANADKFTFVAPAGAPAVSSVSPISGGSAGADSVVITGSNFAGANSVQFGGVAATFTINSSTQITATAPAGSGTVDVMVTTPSGTSARVVPDEYSYTFASNGYAVSLGASTVAPAVSGLVVLTATANQDITISGFGISIFDASTGVELVHVVVGSTAAAVVSQASAGSQRYVAEISNAGGTNPQAASAPVVVTWSGVAPPPAPAVTGISPTSGPAGTAVTISGTNFTGATSVVFGTASAAFTVTSSTKISATAPAGSGTVDVNVTTPAGTSASSTSDVYAYTTSGGGGGGPSGLAMPTGDIPGWHMVFSDDFTGTSLNTNAWGTYSGQPGGDSGAWWDPSHVVVKDGELVLENFVDPAHDGGKSGIYVSGGVSSANALTQQYGKYLMRFRADGGLGIAQIGLLWPSNNSWPPEIDFDEDAGEDGLARAHSTATYHCGSNGNDSCQVAHTLSNVDLTQWHTIGVEWTAAGLVYTFDGQNWATVPASVQKPPSIPMEFDIQTQAGDCSQFLPCPNSSQTPKEVDMDVDWVVAYAPA